MRACAGWVYGVVSTLSCAIASADGSDDLEWDTEPFTLRGVDGGIRDAVVVDDGRGPALHVGGDFEIAGNATASNIARWDGTAWTALRTNPRGVGLGVRCGPLPRRGRADARRGRGPSLCSCARRACPGGQAELPEPTARRNDGCRRLVARLCRGNGATAAEASGSRARGHGSERTARRQHAITQCESQSRAGLHARDLQAVRRARARARLGTARQGTLYPTQPAETVRVPCQCEARNSLGPWNVS